MAHTLTLDGPRLIRPGELPASQGLFQICFGAPDFPYPEAEVDKPYETCVIADQGALVAQVTIFYKQLHVYDSVVRTASIGGVCTHPDYRGYGLASRLMEYCTRRLARAGARLMVISGGRGLYTRLGCVPMGTFAAFTIHSASSSQADGVDQEVQLRSAVPGDAHLCWRLYQEQAVHYRRSERVFRESFQPHPIGFRAEELVAETGGQTEAYLVFNVPWEFLDEPNAGIRQIAEYAGRPAALGPAMLAAASHLQLRELQAPVPWQHTQLIQFFREGGHDPNWSGLPDHTIRVVDLPGLMSDLASYIQERLPRSLRRGLRFEQTGSLLAGNGSDRYSILRGRHHLDLDGAAMTHLVMGHPDGGPQDIPAPGSLAEIIPALFPLPSFFTGLDYH